jgi:hypothetical protein
MSRSPTVIPTGVTATFALCLGKRGEKLIVNVQGLHVVRELAQKPCSRLCQQGVTGGRQLGLLADRLRDAAAESVGADGGAL